MDRRKRSRGGSLLRVANLGPRESALVRVQRVGGGMSAIDDSI